MRKRIALTLSLLVLTLSACTGSQQSGQAPKPLTTTQPAPAAQSGPFASEIEVGVITSLTGSWAKFGEMQKGGYEIALDEINKGGGILGAKLKLAIEDDASKGENAISLVEKLAIQKNVPIILGAYGSGATFPAAKKASELKVPFLVPTSFADNITSFGSRYVFRITSTSTEMSVVATDFLKDVVKPQKIAIVYENTNFGTSTSKPIKDTAEKAGIKVVAFEAYAAGATDFKPMLQKVKGANPEAIVYVSYLNDAVLLMRQSKELDLNVKAVVGAGAGFSVPEFIDSQGAGKNAEYTFSATPWMPDVKWKGAKEFNDEFKRRYGYEPSYHAAQAHAALYVLKNVLERAKSLDREKIREALATTDMAPNDTIFGPIKFNDKGQNAHPMLVTQVQGGKYVTVWPADVAVTKPIIPMPAWKDRK